MKFAAFIMTFERSEIILDTVSRFFDQTLPPDKILIIDNSYSVKTQKLIKAQNNPKLSYYRVGYNSGPAGAAYYAMQLLQAEQYDWIAWGDDDDPPRANTLFERMFTLIRDFDLNKVGVIGTNGSLFNKKNGQLIRIPTEALTNHVEVDQIPGGAIPIVNAEVLKSGCFPDKDFFFGFEELDFCLTVKKAGYKNYINGELCYENRIISNRLNYTSRIPTILKKDSDQIWRDYYSKRNLLYLCFHKHGLKRASLRITFKIFFQAILGFSRGFSFGFLNAKLMFLAILHAYLKKMGKTIDPPTNR